MTARILLEPSPEVGPANFFLNILHENVKVPSNVCPDTNQPIPIRDAFQKKKTPYGGTLSQPHITPSPPSKVGTKIEGTFLKF